MKSSFALDSAPAFANNLLEIAAAVDVGCYTQRPLARCLQRYNRALNMIDIGMYACLALYYQRDQLINVASEERRSTHEELVCDHSERPQVSAMIVW